MRAYAITLPHNWIGAQLRRVKPTPQELTQRVWRPRHRDIQHHRLLRTFMPLSLLLALDQVSHPASCPDPFSELLARCPTQPVECSINAFCTRSCPDPCYEILEVPSGRLGTHYGCTLDDPDLSILDDPELMPWPAATMTSSTADGLGPTCHDPRHEG